MAFQRLSTDPQPETQEQGGEPGRGAGWSGSRAKGRVTRQDSAAPVGKGLPVPHGAWRGRVQEQGRQHSVGEGVELNGQQGDFWVESPARAPKCAPKGASG